MTGAAKFNIDTAEASWLITALNRRPLNSVRDFPRYLPSASRNTYESGLPNEQKARAESWTPVPKPDAPSDNHASLLA